MRPQPQVGPKFAEGYHSFYWPIVTTCCSRSFTLRRACEHRC